MWLQDTGILHKLAYDVLNPPILIPDMKVRYNQPLNLKQLGITGIMILIGLFISLTVFLREIWTNRTLRPNSPAKESFEMSQRRSSCPSTDTNELPVHYADENAIANYLPI